MNSYEEAKEKIRKISDRIKKSVESTREAFFMRWDSSKKKPATSLEEFETLCQVVLSFEKEEKQTIEEGMNDLKVVGGYSEIEYWEKQLAKLNSSDPKINDYKKMISILVNAMGKFKENEQECKKNYEQILSNVRQCESLADTSTDWHGARDEMKKVQEKLKSVKLQKDQQNELWQRMNAAFEKLGRRQTEEREKYESECNSNYVRLGNKVKECQELAGYSTDWHGSRDHIKGVQEELKSTKLKREQRDNLFGRVKEAFDTLGRRQTAEREKLEAEYNSNYASLDSKMTECVRLANYSTDWKGSREILKNTQEELKRVRLKREQRDELWQRMNNTFETLNSRANAYYEQQKKDREKERELERRRRLQEKIDSLQQALDNIKNSVERDVEAKMAIARKWKDVRPGKNSDAIKAKLDQNSRAIQDRIDSKDLKYREIHNKILELKRQL